MPLFGKSKTVKDQVKTLKENSVSLKATPNDQRKVSEVTKSLTSLRDLVIDKSDSSQSGKDRDTELTQVDRTRLNETISEVTNEFINLGVLPLLLSTMKSMEFEGPKLIALIFAKLVDNKAGSSSNALVEYLDKNRDLLFEMLTGYENESCALPMSEMLRQACRHQRLTHIVLESPQFYQLFAYIKDEKFHISADAFNTLNNLLRTHPRLVAEFLTKNYTTFFQHYHELFEVNYVLKRLALKLLGELLAERCNFDITKRYVSDADNLKLIMNLLNGQQKHVRFEAFHCFKNFVFFSNRTESVHKILWLNKDKLLEFFSNFLEGREEDHAFNDEKACIIKRISELKEPVKTSQQQQHQYASSAQ